MSHSITVRSSIAAFSIGTTSSRRERVMTKPPTCWERWRGESISSVGQRHHLFSRGSEGSRPALRASVLRDAVGATSPKACWPAHRWHPGKPEHLADFTNGASSAIADHGRGNAGTLAAIFLVDVLDDLFAPLVLEIDIDVGRLARSLDTKRSNRRSIFSGSTLGDAEAIADQRIRGRTTTLAQNGRIKAARD